jgi:hypothetical protein
MITSQPQATHQALGNNNNNKKIYSIKQSVCFAAIWLMLLGNFTTGAFPTNNIYIPKQLISNKHN